MYSLHQIGADGWSVHPFWRQALVECLTTTRYSRYADRRVIAWWRSGPDPGPSWTFLLIRHARARGSAATERIPQRSVESTLMPQKSVANVTDRDTGQSRGFGFVEVETAEAGEHSARRSRAPGRDLEAFRAAQRRWLPPAGRVGQQPRTLVSGGMRPTFEERMH